MKTRTLHIIFLLCLLTPFCAVAADDDETIVGDTISDRKMEKWYNRIWEFRKVADNESARDSFRTEYGTDFWKLAALSGKLDLKDKTIKYPKFIKACIDVYNWGDRTFNSYDTTYVVGTGKRWKLMTKNDNWIDFYNLRLSDRIHIGMSSDIAPNISASLSYMALSVSYMLNLDYVFGGQPVKHKRFDVNFSCSLIAFDGYYSKFTGNTNISRLGNYRNYNFFKSDYSFSGLTLDSYGLDVYYFFNNKKYSQGAAYSYSKYQKKSAGSFISGLTFSRQNVKMDFNTLPDDIVEEIPADKRYYHIYYNDYCIMLGYGYNWVFRKNWLFNITFIPCVGFNHSMNDTEERRKDMFSYNIKAKFALVYNHNRFFYSVNGKFDGHFYNSYKYKFFNSYTNLAFVAGFRF